MCKKYLCELSAQILTLAFDSVSSVSEIMSFHYSYSSDSYDLPDSINLDIMDDSQRLSELSIFAYEIS